MRFTRKQVNEEVNKALLNKIRLNGRLAMGMLVFGFIGGGTAGAMLVLFFGGIK